MERRESVTLGELKWNRQNLTFQSPTSPSPLASVLMLKKKTERERIISLTFLPRNSYIHDPRITRLCFNYKIFVFICFINFYSFKMVSFFL